MIEPEMAFTDLDGITTIAEDLVKYVVADLFEKAPEEMNFFCTWVEKDLHDQLHPLLEKKDFARLDYTKAVEILQQKKHVRFA
jgi:asparaginyl-tRNA synthetase